ncbi:MAG: hypothetical protein ACD_43C00021G0005 [uncultured bacterium]|nr:MAG: hypothetical protein ACD_43C00021G0005 [uncultured bacterium]
MYIEAKNLPVPITDNADRRNDSTRPLTEENPATLAEQSEKNTYERYKERFVVEKIIPYADNYDYSEFSDNNFVEGLRSIKESYNEGSDTYNVDINSFSIEELETLWQMVDSRLYEQQTKKERAIRLEEVTKISSGKWKYSSDGRLMAKAKNPCVIGGVHGDETTLSNDMAKALETQRAPLIMLDQSQGYSNWRVNVPAYDNNVRGFSTAKQEAEEASDMNRLDIDDPTTRVIKERILREISQYEVPFLLDCHNDNSIVGEASPEKRLPFAYITDTGDVSHKINLATELGLHRVIIIPPEAMAGSMVESLREIKPQSDGMTVEVNGSDTSGISARIALRFLQMSEVLNQHRPSNGVQMLHEFQTTFLPPNPNLKIFNMQPIPEEQLGADDASHYIVIDEKPMRITRVKIEGEAMLQESMAEDDKRLFE